MRISASYTTDSGKVVSRSISAPSLTEKNLEELNQMLKVLCNPMLISSHGSELDVEVTDFKFKMKDPYE